MGVMCFLFRFTNLKQTVQVALEGIMKGDILSSGATHSTPREQTPNKIQDNGSRNCTQGWNNGEWSI